MVVGECLYHNKEYVVKIDFTMKNLFVSVLLIIGISVTSCSEKETLFYITTSVIPEGAGVITPSSTEVLEGSNVSFKATPNGEYIFTGWSGSISGTTNPQKITVTSDMNVTANFALRSYPLTLSTEGEGQIIEKVISTRADYTSGTVVELSAQPSEHWQFSHWEGDITGPENPAQITVSSAKSVKAIFTKKSYDYSLKIVGPGAVDEEIVESTRATLEAGTIVRLSAYPDTRNNAVFTGWSGDITGTDHVIEVNIDDVKNITATFSDVASISGITPEIIDLKSPSAILPFFYWEFNPSQYVNSSYRYLAIDYNLDGYLDLITTMSDRTINSSIPIKFYLGQSDGSLVEDVQNSGKYGSTNWSRKLLYSDFNSDNYPDIFICSHGFDNYPWPCEEPIILLSNGNGRFVEKRYHEYRGFHHGGATGDLDNDGDVDVLCSDETNSLLFINNGAGNFEVTNSFINQELLKWKVSFEIYDINKDGFLDIIAGGHEWLTRDDMGGDIELDDYSNTSIIFWGKGDNNFTNCMYDYMPKYNVRNGYGIVLDYEFYDVNSDGNDEIIVLRTGDNSKFSDLSYYQGWAIQILEFTDGEYKDVTETFINGKSYNENFQWISWIDIQKIGDKVYLTGAPGEDVKVIKLYEISGNSLKLIDNDYTTLLNGFSIYSDISKVPILYGLPDGFTIDGKDINMMHSDAFSGTSSIYIKQNYKSNFWEQGINFYFNTKIDMSKLINEYYLESYIKSDNKDVKIQFTFSDYSTDYFYTIDSNYVKFNGDWECVRIPLSTFMTNGKNWKIQRFGINLTSDKTQGAEVLIDEIRIRKAL